MRCIHEIFPVEAAYLIHKAIISTRRANTKIAFNKNTKNFIRQKMDSSSLFQHSQEPIVLNVE